MASLTDNKWYKRYKEEVKSGRLELPALEKVRCYFYACLRRFQLFGNYLLTIQRIRTGWLSFIMVKSSVATTIVAEARYGILITL
jgi:hypothetical protein